MDATLGLCGRLAISIGSGELVGRYAGKLPKHDTFANGMGAFAGLLQHTLHLCLEPTWTAIRLSTRLNPIGQAVLMILEILAEAVIAALAMHHVFNRNLTLQQGTVLTAESAGVAAVMTFLSNAAWKAMT